MVANFGGRYQPQVRIIESILQEANVPRYWYSINEPIDDRISITSERDGIHVFISDRGQRTGEKVYNDWQTAIKNLANSFELSYTEKVQKIADMKNKQGAAKRLEQTKFHKEMPSVNIGDTIRVFLKIQEGKNGYFRTFQGTLVAKHKSYRGETFTIRRSAYGISVERKFSLNLPNIDHIEIIRSGRVRQLRKRNLQSRIAKMQRTDT